VANAFNVDTAETALVKYLQWRLDEKVDDIINNPPKSIDLIRGLAPYAYHGFDNDGRPIYIEKTGAIHCSKLADPNIVEPAEFVRAHVYGMEVLMKSCDDQSKLLGRRIVDIASILDMEGLGFHHRVAISILQQSMQIDTAYYPIRIGRVYILNTPWVAPYLYQIVSPLLPEDIRARVHVVQGNPGDFLTTVIPADQLPPQYGGTCNKHDGKCLPALADDSNAGDEDDVGMETEYVSTDLEKEASSNESGCTFSWFFKCDEGYDIDFSVIITDQGKNGGQPFAAKPPGRCNTNRGSYTSIGPCKMVCKWDNNFSWMNGKNIKYMIGTLKIDVEGAFDM
jgi:hypothetical protein